MLAACPPLGVKRPSRFRKTKSGICGVPGIGYGRHARPADVERWIVAAHEGGAFWLKQAVDLMRTTFPL